MKATCTQCGAAYEQGRRDQRYCSRRCTEASQPPCSEPDCARPRMARGLCKQHWKRAHGKDRKRFEITCLMCGRQHWHARPDGMYCSESCAQQHRWMPRKQLTPWIQPIGYVRPRRLARVVTELPPRKTTWTSGQCPGCGDWFLDVMPQARYCSVACGRRWQRRMRSGRGHGAAGTFTWAEVMRLYLLFDRRCAYCEEPVTGQLDPDHVVPLSKGGSNSITNILPACHPCNGDKRNLSITEWNADRARRGLPPRRTEWPEGDPRVIHLTSVSVVRRAG